MQLADAFGGTNAVEVSGSSIPPDVTQVEQFLLFLGNTFHQ